MDGQRNVTRRVVGRTACGPLLLLLVFSGCEKAAPVGPSRIQVESGIRQLDRNEVDAAITSFTGAIESADDTADAHNADPFYYRGMAYVSQGLADKAVDDFTRALSIDARYVRAYCGRGIAFMRKGLIDVALEDFSKAIALNPRYAEPRWRRAQAYLDAGSYTRAIRDALRTIQLSPQEPAAFGILGSAYLASRQYRKATDYLDEAVRIDPTLTQQLDPQRRDAYSDLAQQLEAEGKVDGAAAVSERAGKIWPDWVPPPRPSTGAAHVPPTFTADDPTGPDATDVADVVPPVPSPHEVGRVAPPGAIANDALDLVQAKKFDEAIAKLTRAIATDPRSAPLRYVRGLAYLKQGFPDTAIEEFNRVIYRAPEPDIGRITGSGGGATTPQPELDSTWQEIMADVYGQRGAAHWQLGHLLTATRDCTQAILRRPDDVSAYQLRGLAYFRMEKFDRTVEDCTQVIRLRPDDADPYYLRGLAYFKLDQFDRTAEDCTQVIRLRPDDAGSHYLRSRAYFKLNQFEQAAEDCTQTVRCRPKDARVYYFRGLAHLKLNRLDRVDADVSELQRLNADLAEKLRIKAKEQRAADRLRTGQDRDGGQSSVSNDRAA